MGKTSLVRQLRERLPAGTAFRLGRCLSYGRGVTYSALADVLRQELGLRQEDSAEDMLERLAGREILGLTLGLDVAGDLEPRAALLQPAGPVGAADLAARRGGTCGAGHRGSALGRRAAGRGARTRALEGGGPGPRARNHAARAGGIPGGGHAEPGAPRRRGGGRAHRGCARRRPLEPRALELVAGHAEGNPFFVEEVLADLLDRGLLERGTGGWSLRTARSISASRTPFRASSPPASTCCRPRRRRRSRPRR